MRPADARVARHERQRSALAALKAAGKPFSRLANVLLPYTGELRAERADVLAPRVQMDGFAWMYWPEDRPCWVTSEGPIPLDTCTAEAA